MTPSEISRLEFWFNSYCAMLEDIGRPTVAKIARMVFNNFIHWMEN